MNGVPQYDQQQLFAAMLQQQQAAQLGMLAPPAFPPPFMPPFGAAPGQFGGAPLPPPHGGQQQHFGRGGGGGGFRGGRGGGGRGGGGAGGHPGAGAAAADPAAAAAAAAERAARNNEIGDASRVVHMRNVTPEVSQLSIQNLVQSFGRIRSIVMLRQKNQALVEMETQAAAQQLVDFFRDPGYAEIDGRRVYVRYSTHQELTATQHVSKTLLVSMFNTQYDVSAAAQITPSIVFQIFGAYGTVEKIVVLPKNDSSAQNYHRVQALVQFDAKETAEHVKSTLQGQPVTLGDTVTFTLDIQFSRMDEIKTSSPHNSLVIPKGATPQQQQQLLLQHQMLLQQQHSTAAAFAANAAAAAAGMGGGGAGGAVQPPPPGASGGALWN